MKNNLLRAREVQGIYCRCRLPPTPPQVWHDLIQRKMYLTVFWSAVLTMKFYFKSEANNRLREKCTRGAFLSGLKCIQCFSSFQIQRNGRTKQVHGNLSHPHHHKFQILLSVKELPLKFTRRARRLWCWVAANHQEPSGRQEIPEADTILGGQVLKGNKSKQGFSCRQNLLFESGQTFFYTKP